MVPNRTKMTIAEKRHYTLKIVLILTALLQAMAGYGASVPPDKRLDIDITSGRLSMTIHKARLGDVVIKIDGICGIAIVGLEERKKEIVSFQIGDATLENAFKAFLKHLGETSYAFQYRGDHLYRIAVVKESKKAYPSGSETAPVDLPPPEITSSIDLSRELTLPPSDEESPSFPVEPNPHLADPDRAPDDDDDMVKAVRVINVVAESQGAKAGLMKGDIILEYDGVPIDQPETLINNVKHNISREKVTITVERDEEIIEIDLQGGFIGVSIVPVTLPR